ncbi:MAG: antibiotic resistance protein [Gammaproteobacteria bacterium CG_4_10_14_0_8_um_filter_38_16]|nr:MAG: antibiotic resistance protein [Gammaproteobacteria bacterium CG_4_10_14_0_8_um_filter_38_16]PJA04128.1 MAG: antibiotic resistance protein [Gammaproteobacteria bacterium CG_4_10_14_0_2_um_filter_38_22]PJB10005.1 MAG: antibiotic resistance protein [Gammaproteobacteria bacterium CG_4_9_14_3_um_filter_38_9]
MHHNLLNDFLYAFIAIFPMVNPIAMSSLFYSLTQSATDAEIKKLAWLVALYSSTLLLGTLIIGPYLLHFFGLQSADIRVAGGLVVFSIAWKMLVEPREPKPNMHNEIKSDDIMSLAFFPLTMPLTAGAGSIAIVIALATHAEKTISRVDQYSAIAMAIIAILLLIYVCYRYSATIFKTLGKTGSKVVSSLSAFILLAIGVSVTWGGLQVLIASGIH